MDRSTTSPPPASAPLVLNCFGFFPSHPSPTSAQAVALLGRQGLRATQLDVNWLTWDALFDRESLQRRSYRPEHIGEKPFPACPPLDRSAFERLKGAAADNIEAAKQVLRQKRQFLDVRKQSWALYTFYQAQQVIYYSTGTFITNHAVHWPKLGFDVDDLEQIGKLSCSEELNPLLEPLRERVLPRILARAPSWIGIDIAFPWEVIGMLTLNRLVKQALPQTHITFMGHGFDEVSFCRMTERLRDDPRLFFECDSLFLVRHDAGLVRLVTSPGCSREQLEAIPNLAFKDGEGCHVPEGRPEFQADQQVLPDYDGIDFPAYYVPERVILDKFSSKCYWSSCAYCAINLPYGRRQELSVEQCLERVEHYRTKYGCRHLWLLDEAARPDFAEAFSRELLHRGGDLCWSLRTRVDPGYSTELLHLMHQAGCRELWVGLEAVSPALLKIMNKTRDPQGYAAVAKRIMRDCDAIGIGIHFCLMFGVPGETAGDRAQLVEFFKQTRPWFSRRPLFLTFNHFSLMPGSRMQRKPEEYGIEVLPEPPGSFHMISLPYTTPHREGEPGQLEAQIEHTVDQIMAVVCPGDMLRPSWFYSRDSVYELLLKERFSEAPGNPYLHAPGWAERAFGRLLPAVERLPGMAPVTNRLTRLLLGV